MINSLVIVSYTVETPVPGGDMIVWIALVLFPELQSIHPVLEPIMNADLVRQALPPLFRSCSYF